MAIKKFLSESGFKHFVEKCIGKTDISSIGDGTIKGAVSELNLKMDSADNNIAMSIKKVFSIKTTNTTTENYLNKAEPGKGYLIFVRTMATSVSISDLGIYFLSVARQSNTVFKAMKIAGADYIALGLSDTIIQLNMEASYKDISVYEINI